MAVIQQNLDEIRYMRRRNLDEEARIVRNYYADYIRQYGLDVSYYKMNTSGFENFKNIVDQNTLLKRAYGYEMNPEYHPSVDMVAYAEIDSDVFNLNKYGFVPNTDITLTFDAIQFACDMAPYVGVYREYPIERTEVVCEVPPFDSSVTSYVDPATGAAVSGYVSSDTWPYGVGLGRAERFRCEACEGSMRCVLSGYELGVERTVMCDPYEHVDFKLQFPRNDDLYYSLQYKMRNEEYLETMLWLTYRVDRLGDADPRYMLSGYVHGSVLFFDLDRMGKYCEKIRPDVGDIVALDFPDENNREKYEITECLDKQLTQDGLNPLLHKYIWRCKARRYINSHEEGAPGSNEADSRLDERREYEQSVDEEVAEAVSKYRPITGDDGPLEDAVYGGYERENDGWDKQDLRRVVHRKYDFLPGGRLLEIAAFECGARLLTDGYRLVYAVPGEVDPYTGEPSETGYLLADCDHEPATDSALFESGVRWLKATNDQVVFVNIEGQATALARTDELPPDRLQMSLNSLYDATVDAGRPVNGRRGNFYKFRGTRTVLWSANGGLYVKFAKGQLYQIISAEG